MHQTCSQIALHNFEEWTIIFGRDVERHRNELIHDIVVEFEYFKRIHDGQQVFLALILFILSVLRNLFDPFKYIKEQVREN